MSGVDGIAGRFDLPVGSYLLSHSVGLPLGSVIDDLGRDYFDVWRSNPEAAWPAWLGVIDDFRGALAGLLGGDAASLCPQSNVSSGFTKILQAIRPDDRTPVVLLAEDAFPSLGYVCEHAGYEVRYIPASADVLDLEVWNEHLGGGAAGPVDGDIDGEVDVVLITHVHSNTGQLIPVADVAAVARRHGVTTVVDVAQSVGVIPIDVVDWSVDFVVGSCVKWLCGGPGAGWMWVNPSVLDGCSPTDVGWFSHDDPFEFDIHRFRYADDALRFWGGTPTVLPFAVARRSIEVMAEVGAAEIRRHNVELANRLIDACDALVVSPRDVAHRSGTVVVDPGARAAAVVTALAASGVKVDVRATGVRISPHVYNTADDIDRAIQAITS